jgi:DNA-binding LacI/PurR family transcriptional regulator
MILDPGEGRVTDRLRRLLSAKKKPDGVCVFWKGVAHELRRAAAELGLEIGSDLQLVGWAVEEFYEVEHASTYVGLEVPPAVVWQAADMAQAALDRLEARRRGLKSSPARISVPTRIRGE